MTNNSRERNWYKVWDDKRDVGSPLLPYHLIKVESGVTDWEIKWTKVIFIGACAKLVQVVYAGLFLCLMINY